MKKRLATGYTFNAAAKTVLHADFSDIGLAGILLVTNVTTNVVIYQFNNSAKGGSLSGDTLTLDFDTSAMSDTDKLMILVEDGTQPTTPSDTQTVAGAVTVTGVATAANQTTANTSLSSIDSKLTNANTATAKISPTVTVINGSTAETTVLSAIAATYLDVYGATFTNTSTSATKVTLKDDTAGSTRWTGMVPAGETRGFMLPAESAVPQAVSNKPWTVTCGTSVSSLEVTLFATKR